MRGTKTVKKIGGEGVNFVTQKQLVPWTLLCSDSWYPASIWPLMLIVWGYFSQYVYNTLLSDCNVERSLVTGRNSLASSANNLQTFGISEGMSLI